MLEQIIMSGFGGQGIISMGQLWVYAGMHEGKNVTYFPFYGAEKRGGIARASVIVSDNEIDCPVVSTPDTIVIMNNSSLKIYENEVKKGGRIFINSSLVKDEIERDDVEVYAVPCNELANEIGNPRAANMVMLGALSKITGVVEFKDFEEIQKGFFPPNKHKFIESNLKAFEKGRENVEKIK